MAGSTSSSAADGSTPIDVDRMATELWRAEQTGGAVPLLSDRHPELSWIDARLVARAVDRLRLADGCRPIGFKLGWTSAAMRESLGIDRPNWGTLWAHQIVAGPLDISTLRHPKIEPEIVYRVGRRLQGREVSADQVVDDVQNGSAGWALGLEVVHPRFPDFGFTWLDNTADNSSSQAVVIGDPAGIADPASIEVTFTDGETRHRGVASAAMGSPAEAVAWLVRSLADEGAGLDPGQVVFTGGLTAPFDVRPGGGYLMEANMFPPAALTVAMF